MKLNHYGQGDFRIRRPYDWRTIDYYYFATREDARVSLLPGDRLEWWNGEVWVI
jgi:hypothetical protein